METYSVERGKEYDETFYIEKVWNKEEKRIAYCRVAPTTVYRNYGGCYHHLTYDIKFNSI